MTQSVHTKGKKRPGHLMVPTLLKETTDEGLEYGDDEGLEYGDD